VALQEDLKQEDSIPLLQHLPLVCSLEAFGNAAKRSRKRLLANVIEEPDVIIKNCR
jgi:hypothetical protein